MKTISIDRPAEWDICEVYCFADVHLGDPLCDGKLLQERIKKCEETDNCVVLLNGDLVNNAVKTGKSDIYSESISPMEALKRVVALFGRLAEQDKIIALTDGNHERRTYRNDGIDLSEVIATQLGIRERYSPGAALVFLRFGRDSVPQHHHRKMLYTLFANHGAGGGKMVGGKANRVVAMDSICDADCFWHSHTHEPLIVKRGFFRTSPANNSVTYVERLYINTGCLQDYGGYAEQGEFVPASKSTPVVYLDGHKRRMWAAL